MVAARKRRRKHKEQSYVLVSTAPEPSPPDLATLPEDLHYSRERMFVIAAACRFEKWLIGHIAQLGIPRDDCNIPVTLLPIYVEAMLMLRVKCPETRPGALVEDEPDDGFWTPETESEAASVGLSVRKVKRGERRPPANLPGCQGDKGTCPQFRRFGERFCDGHRQLELERIRRSAIQA